MVFAVTTSKERYSGEREGCNKHRDIRHWQVHNRTTHSPKILFILHCVDDRSSTQEQKSLEKGMINQMKEAASVHGETTSSDHIA